MPDTILDGRGQGNVAGVDLDGRLKVVSKNKPLQHLISQEDEEVYQVIGTAPLAATTVVALHIKNLSSTKNIIITYIRHQIIGPAGGATLPDAGNYYSIALGRTYVSGGSVAIPINVHVGSGHSANVIVYKGAPVLTGTAEEIDRWYTKAEADMNSFNKEGALIISPNNTMELSYIGDQTSGTIYTRLSFALE